MDPAYVACMLTLPNQNPAILPERGEGPSSGSIPEICGSVWKSIYMIGKGRHTQAGPAGV